MISKPLFKFLNRPEKKYSRLVFYSVGGFVCLLLLLAAIWLGLVYFQSQVGGARPPYLLMNSSDSIRIRWGTDDDVTGRVFYGTEPGKLDKVVAEQDAVRDHRVTLGNLQPGTRYYYRIQNNTDWLQEKPEWFYTSPAESSNPSSRVWVLGDPGYASESQRKVRDSALAWMQRHMRPQHPYLDMVLTTGDNAYNSGKNAEFDRNFFQSYKYIFRNIPVWPVFGNHDARRWAFYDIFDSPMQGQSGGVPSGNRAWFAFDHGYAHFVILDSHHSDMSPDSPMLNWLREDLKQNRHKWTIVLFHEPPYTRSTHNSDSKKDSRGRLFRVRENILPVLERAGVDLVFSGHSHTYERTHLLSCHYGTSDTLQQWMVQGSKTASNKLVPVYIKSDINQASFTGTIYMVVGSSAKVDEGPLDHPAMSVSLKQTGSVILDINHNSLSSIFLNEDGEISDQFSILKDGSVKPERFDSCNKRQVYYSKN